MTDLQECRRKIDEIDNQMVELFEKRMKVCEEVAEYKIHTGKKVLDPEREHAKLEEIRKKAHGEFNELGAQELFQQIMAISRKRQYQLLTEYGPKEKEDFQMPESHCSRHLLHRKTPFLQHLLCSLYFRHWNLQFPLPVFTRKKMQCWH